MKKNISIFLVLTLAMTLIFASSVSAATYVDEAGSGGTPPKPKTGAPVETGTGGVVTAKKNAAPPSVDEDPLLPPVDVVDPLDEDGDGVPNELDLCPGTDSTTSHWFTYDTYGWNTWKFSSVGWATRNLKDTGLLQGPKGSYTLEDTMGCSCTQIVDKIKELTADESKGKFSCSISLLDDFTLDIADGAFDGYELVETVVVPANSLTPTLSVAVLETETIYQLTAYGTADAGDGITFDAQYATIDLLNWTDLVPGYEDQGAGLLNLYVDGVDTGWGAFNAAHSYTIEYTGTGAEVAFHIFDIFPSNNTGGLSVDILKPIY